MANFKGHALPGSFFILFGLWWSVRCSLKYISRSLNKNSRVQWNFKHLEIIEGAVKVGFATVGILAEQFVPDGPHLYLYSGQPRSWVKLMNWQHSTMYLFFGISGAADIITYSLTKMPIGLDRFMFAISFFVEGFLFYFHISHRPMLDQHIHSLLLMAIFGSAATCLIQTFMRDNMILDFFIASLALLQGTWFWQIGFVLYPPWGGPEWDESDHGNIMFITMCFCWHYAIAILIIAVNYSLVYCCIQSCRRSNRQIRFGLGIKKQNNSHAPLLNGLDDE
ncbi:transmembrane protein 45B [Python bivittatus]|uniref:Transmembrane protein 45B n=1 Tax=Python bivittatus TaxID=176946 RepID=A0A9F2RBH4_PYTBI|nr:transmembrane protein 45B [Python bivittatus]